jgi:hypothetical protein
MPVVMRFIAVAMAASIVLSCSSKSESLAEEFVSALGRDDPHFLKTLVISPRRGPRISMEERFELYKRDAVFLGLDPSAIRIVETSTHRAESLGSVLVTTRVEARIDGVAVDIFIPGTLVEGQLRLGYPPSIRFPIICDRITTKIQRLAQQSGSKAAKFWSDPSGGGDICRINWFRWGPTYDACIENAQTLREALACENAKESN